MKYSPIIIFAFNRLDSLKETVESLKKNEESALSDLFIFVDGPRPNRIGEAEQVQQVKDYVANIKGFKSLHCRFSSNNKGLGNSIIAGVSEIINQYGTAIVLEDDLIFSSNFLSYINQSLEKYDKAKEVFSICGYSLKVKFPKDYKHDAYFCHRSSSWGWATWSDRWNSVDWKLENWNDVEKNAKSFNKWGGSDCYSMLNAWKEGKNKSWAIRFCYAQFVSNTLSLFPVKSMVENNGFDGNGTNCKKYSRFKSSFEDCRNKSFDFPANITVNNVTLKSFLSYHSIIKRIISKIRYVIG